MFTLNKLNKIIQEFVANHRQIKSWRLENYGDFSDITYPLLAGLIQPSPVDSASSSFVVKFWILDKVTKGLNNQVDCLSDTHSMGLDVLSYFKQTNFDELGYLGVVQTATFDRVIEDGEDEVSGWTFEVTFKTIFEWDLCSIPITN